MASLNSRQSQWAWCFIQQPSQQTRLLQIPVSKVKTNLKIKQIMEILFPYQYHYRNLHVHLDKHHHFIFILEKVKIDKLLEKKFWRQNFIVTLAVMRWYWWWCCRKYIMYPKRYNEDEPRLLVSIDRKSSIGRKSDVFLHISMSSEQRTHCPSAQPICLQKKTFRHINNNNPLLPIIGVALPHGTWTFQTLRYFILKMEV